MNESTPTPTPAAVRRFRLGLLPPGLVDRAIYPLVAALRDVGVKTTGSCEGHQDEADPWPYVQFDTDTMTAASIDCALIALASAKLPEDILSHQWRIDAFFSVSGGHHDLLWALKPQDCDGWNRDTLDADIAILTRVVPSIAGLVENQVAPLTLRDAHIRYSEPEALNFEYMVAQAPGDGMMG